LRGFPPSDRYRVVEAVERELERLIAQRGIASLLTENEGFEKRSFQLESNAGPSDIGVQVARQIMGAERAGEKAMDLIGFQR